MIFPYFFAIYGPHCYQHSRSEGKTMHVWNFSTNIEVLQTSSIQIEIASPLNIQTFQDASIRAIERSPSQFPKIMVPHVCFQIGRAHV